VWGLYLDPNGNANVAGAAVQGGAGQQRRGDAFFGAPPGPGEILIGPGGEYGVGPVANAGWFARRAGQGAGGIAHLPNLVPNLMANFNRRHRDAADQRPAPAPFPLFPQNFFQAPGHAVPPPGVLHPVPPFTNSSD
jgi:hypothetical protein